MFDFLRFYTAMFRRFRTLVLGREVQIVGQCRMCGECCHGIVLKDEKWLRKKKDFDALCDEEPGHSRFEITGRDDFGHLVFRCTMQGEDNFCTCYNDRLSLCRNYPSKSIYYQGGWMRPDCGFRFKSVTFRDVFLRRQTVRRAKFSDILTEELDRDIQQADK